METDLLIAYVDAKRQYQSVTMEDPQEDGHRFYPSIRLFMFILALASSTICGGGFGAFNFALVCMVNETAIISPERHRNMSHNESSVCRMDSDQSSTERMAGYDGEFSWDKATQSSLLAANAIGAVAMVIPSGLLSDRYGSKYVITACAISNVIASALTPTAAYAGFGWLFAVRMLQGFGLSSSWPAIIAMVSTWGAPSEAGTLLTLGSIGYQLGPLLAMATSSVLCESSYRWPIIFYMWAGISAVFIVLWQILYTDQPDKCRFISKTELSYVQRMNMRKGQIRQSFWQIPWRHILSSPSAIAVYFCQGCSTWATFYIGEFLPTYSKEVLRFDIRSNGLTSALPALSQCLARSFFGPIGDKLTCGGRSNTFRVKLFTFMCTVLPAICFLILGFVDCRQKWLAIAAFCIASIFLSTSTVGFVRAGVLMASQYSGLIGSFSNTYGYGLGIVMPYVVGVIVQNGTVQEWRYSAFVAAGVLALSFIQFQAFGTAEKQEWAGTTKNSDKVFPSDTDRKDG